MSYLVKIWETNQTHTFKSVKNAKQFIVDWARENNEHTGKVDICSKTSLWQVGTFNNPVITFERLAKK